MPERQAAGVQGDEPLALVLAPRTESHSAAVEIIAEKRMTAAGALHANLMRAAGFERDFQERRRLWLAGERERLVMENRPAASWVAGIDDDRARLTFDLLQVIRPRVLGRL